MPSSRTMLLGAINRDLAAKMLKDKARELVGAVREALPKNFRFVLILGDGERAVFMSDSSREDAAKDVRAALRDLERSD